MALLSASRLLALAGALAAAGAISTPIPAHALTWRWSFSRPADGSGGAVQAGGTLRTTKTPDASGFYGIQSVSGARNTVAITSFLPAGTAIPGNCLNSTTCFKGDNLLRLAGSGGQLTSHGFGVGFADGTYANYFYASFLPTPVDLEYFSAPPFSPIPAGPEDSELAGLFQATPVPGPLPLGGALLTFGWARRLRRRLRGI